MEPGFARRLYSSSFFAHLNKLYPKACLGGNKKIVEMTFERGAIVTDEALKAAGTSLPHFFTRHNFSFISFSKGERGDREIIELLLSKRADHYNECKHPFYFFFVKKTSFR